jgi:hypothetical protein
VALLAAAILVTFFGTLGQVTDGLQLALEKYFHSWGAVWRPDPNGFWGVPLPGGRLVGVLLVINLIAAHFTRFKMTWKRAGIFLTHLGILFLLIGQLATELLSRESFMSFFAGDKLAYAQEHQRAEVAFMIPMDDKQDQVVAFPEESLEVAGTVHQKPELPFAVRVVAYHENANFRKLAPGSTDTPAATQGDGTSIVLVPQTPVRAMNTRNTAAFVLEFATAQGSLGTWVFSERLEPQIIDVAGKKIRAAGRMVRHYNPFTVELIDTRWDKYLGTDIPKNYSSRLRLVDPGEGLTREVEISMNKPLYYRGLTFYQSGMERIPERKDELFSTLQVVHNPVWFGPYLSCGLVSAGLLVQFLIHLVGFLTKRRPA